MMWMLRIAGGWSGGGCGGSGDDGGGSCGLIINQISHSTTVRCGYCCCSVKQRGKNAVISKTNQIGISAPMI